MAKLVSGDQSAMYEIAKKNAGALASLMASIINGAGQGAEDPNMIFSIYQDENGTEKVMVQVMDTSGPEPRMIIKGQDLEEFLKNADLQTMLEKSE